MQDTVKIGVSNRHVHLSREHVDALFGEGYDLTSRNAIRQPGQYAAEERVTLMGKEELPARVVGPLRERTQVEILTEDQEVLGLEAPVKVSGQLDGTPGITLKGPKGQITLEYGVIIAAKHVHMGSQELEEHGLDGVGYVDLRTASGQTFENVPVRAGETHLSEFHLDRDEARQYEMKTGDHITITARRKE